MYVIAFDKGCGCLSLTHSFSLGDLFQYRHKWYILPTKLDSLGIDITVNKSSYLQLINQTSHQVIYVSFILLIVINYSHYACSCNVNSPSVHTHETIHVH